MLREGGRAEGFCFVLDWLVVDLTLRVVVSLVFTVFVCFIFV